MTPSIQLRIFTSAAGAEKAGDHLTELIEKWQKAKNAEIMGVEISSNKYGWMAAVMWKPLAL